MNSRTQPSPPFLDNMIWHIDLTEFTAFEGQTAKPTFFIISKSLIDYQ